MNEKTQKILDKIDLSAEKLAILPKAIDSVNGFIKTPVVSAIPAVVNKIASKFGAVAVTLFGLLYACYCLKNMLISFFFEDAPAGLAFGCSVFALIAIVFSNYIIYKTDGIFDDIVKSSACRISSLNIFSIMTVFSVFASLASFVLGIYATFEYKEFEFFLFGLAGLIFFSLIALYCSTPEDFAITEDKNASAGEDFIALVTFSIKTVLRLVPIAVFVLAIVGIIQCIPETIETYTESVGSSIVMYTESMVCDMTTLGYFLLVGMIPLAAYFYYLGSYVSLDIIRAILSLPRALNELKK